MDISDTIAPNSDQLDAIDLVSGPRTFTITKVDRGNAEQPVQIHLDEFPRPWRPGKSMRRVLVAAWGPDAAQYVGRRVTLYCDATVKFGGEAVGGTRISHMSDLPGNKRLSVPLLISRGKSAMFTVEPLTIPAPTPARPAADKPTPEQMQALANALAAANITDGNDKAAFITETTGRPMTGWADLTATDAQKVIDALTPLVATPTTEHDPWAETEAAVTARDAQETDQ